MKKLVLALCFAATITQAADKEDSRTVYLPPGEKIVRIRPPQYASTSFYVETRPHRFGDEPPECHSVYREVTRHGDLAVFREITVCERRAEK